MQQRYLSCVTDYNTICHHKMLHNKTEKVCADIQYLVFVKISIDYLVFFLYCSTYMSKLNEPGIIRFAMGENKKLYTYGRTK